MTKEQISWTHLPDQELLEIPLSELGLSLEKHPLMKLIKKLTRELEAKKITLRPRVYLLMIGFAQMVRPLLPYLLSSFTPAQKT